MCRRQVDFSCPSRARYPVEHIYRTMRKLEDEGFGRFINNEFFKGPMLTSEMLDNYGILWANYNQRLNENPASGAPHSALARNDQMRIYHSIYKQ